MVLLVRKEIQVMLVLLAKLELLVRRDKPVKKAILDRKVLKAILVMLGPLV